MRKRGMSLIVLTITLIVMSVLAGAIVMSLNNSTDEAKLTGFATELKEILEASQTYYLQHDEFPVVAGMTYSKTDLLGISADAQELENEFNLNHDNSTAYYKLDLSKISNSGGLYGNDEKANDFYVISDDGNFVYYPLGVKVNDNIYYSLTEKLAQIVDLNVAGSTTGDVTNVTTSTKISVAKDTDEWTNSLSLSVNTTLNSGEKLYYIIGNVKTQITGSLPYTFSLSNSTITANSTLETEFAKTQDIVFQKEDSSGKVIAKTALSIENLDIYSPTIGEANTKSYSDYIMVELSNAQDDKSGILASYFLTDSTTYTAAQLVTLGTKASAYSIKLDTDATFVQFVVVDNAGNVSEIKRLNIE